MYWTNQKSLFSMKWKWLDTRSNMKKSMTLRNRLLLLLTITSFSFGCNNSPIREKLLGASVKYWDVCNDETGRIEGAYRFAEDGSCIWMINSRKGPRHYYMAEDVQRDEVWSLDDSILTFRNWHVRILYISEDTLIMKDLDFPSLPIILTKSLDQSDLGVPPSKLKPKNR